MREIVAPEATSIRPAWVKLVAAILIVPDSARTVPRLVKLVGLIVWVQSTLLRIVPSLNQLVLT